eukprot:2314971-Alexandrium_andersonii.AAC.1
MCYNAGTWIPQSEKELAKFHAMYHRFIRCIHRRAYCSLSDAEMLDQVDAPPANMYLSVARLQLFGRLV